MLEWSSFRPELIDFSDQKIDLELDLINAIMTTLQMEMN